jgi:tellurite resistance protein TerC
LELALAPTAAFAVAAGLAVELRLFAPGRAPGRREAIIWSAGWLLLAIAVAVGIALAGGPAGEWTTVYLIERSLSLDNVFLFSLLLAYFLVPPELRRRVVLVGIAGALVLRGIAIAGGVALVESVEVIVYAFGALLLFVAYRALRGVDEASDPEANPMLRSVRRLVPTTDDFRGRRLFVREAGRPSGTPLLLVVVAVIAADIAFAVDSIPAAFAVTRDPLVIWTANAFALLGLGSLLALVEILARRFRYVDETIALVLAFVGTKILAADLFTSATSHRSSSSRRSWRAASSPRSWRTASTRPTQRRKGRDARRDARGSSGIQDLLRGGRHRTRLRVGRDQWPAALTEQTEGQSSIPTSSSDCRSSAGSR